MSMTREGMGLAGAGNGERERFVAPGGEGAGAAEPVGGGAEEYLERLAEEIRERAERQRLLCRRLLGGAAAGGAVRSGCFASDCRRVAAMRAAIRETIEVLEQTRSAFKSKRLEVMRRKLIDVLSE